MLDEAANARSTSGEARISTAGPRLHGLLVPGLSLSAEEIAHLRQTVPEGTVSLNQIAGK